MSSDRDPASQNQLSPQDRRILQRGEISQQRYIWGGVTGSVVGFGVGHTIEGRYRDIGWVFTAGEAASASLLFVAILSCFGDPPPGQTCTPPAALAFTGAAGLIGFHIWEIIDLWVEPPKINERYRQLQGHRHSAWYVAPTILNRSGALVVGYNF